MDQVSANRKRLKRNTEIETLETSTTKQSEQDPPNKQLGDACFPTAATAVTDISRVRSQPTIVQNRVSAQIAADKKRGLDQIGTSQKRRETEFDETENQEMTINTVKDDEEMDKEDQDDPYPDLPKGSQEDGGWRYNKETNEYHLPDWFVLSAQQFNSLFPHQKTGVEWLYNLY